MKKTSRRGLILGSIATVIMAATAKVRAITSPTNIFTEIDEICRRDWKEKTGHEAPKVGDTLKFRASWLGGIIIEGVVEYCTVGLYAPGEGRFSYGVNIGPNHGDSVSSDEVVYDNTPAVPYEVWNAQEQEVRNAGIEPSWGNENTYCLMVTASAFNDGRYGIIDRTRHLAEEKLGGPVTLSHIGTKLPKYGLPTSEIYIAWRKTIA